MREDYDRYIDWLMRAKQAARRKDVFLHNFCRARADAALALYRVNKVQRIAAEMAAEDAMIA